MALTRYVHPEQLQAQSDEFLVVDVREPGEFAGERIPGSVNLPLSRLESEASSLPKGRPLVIACASGRRAEDAARRLAARGYPDVLVLEGGLRGCAGLESGPGGAWSMERQVRMAAGGLVLLGAVLGRFVHPAFGWVSVAVGAGLVFSAATDTCGMARLLALLPWNRGALLVGLLAAAAAAHQGKAHPEAESDARALARVNALYVERVKPIFKQKCFDCHAQAEKLPWYYKLPGAKQLIDYDIREAREHLDMRGDFPFRGHGSPGEDLEEIEEILKEGSMPPWRYGILHPGSSLTQDEAAKIQAWIDESRALLLPR